MEIRLRLRNPTTSRLVIRYPDRTKKIWTPMKPPGKRVPPPVEPTWYATTAATASARMPSSPTACRKTGALLDPAGAEACSGGRSRVARGTGGTVSHLGRLTRAHVGIPLVARFHAASLGGAGHCPGRAGRLPWKGPPTWSGSACHDCLGILRRV